MMCEITELVHDRAIDAFGFPPKLFRARKRRAYWRINNVTKIPLR